MVSACKCVSVCIRVWEIMDKSEELKERKREEEREHILEEDREREKKK